MDIDDEYEEEEEPEEGDDEGKVHKNSILLWNSLFILKSFVVM